MANHTDVLSLLGFLSVDIQFPPSDKKSEKHNVTLYIFYYENNISKGIKGDPCICVIYQNKRKMSRDWFTNNLEVGTTIFKGIM